MSFTPLPQKLRDFRSFLWLVWKHLNLPDPTPIQYDIAQYLQYGPKRKIIQGFRGVGKSWITSAYVLHQLRLDPQQNFLVISASKSRSDDFSTFTLRLIKEMEILSCLRPNPEQRESKIAFDVGPALADHAPSVKSVGIFGQLTGTRADEIIADDVEVPNNTQTQQAREKLAETVKEFDSIIKPGGRITYLGTPQSIESLYNTLAERGYAPRIWPVRYPELAKINTVYGEKLAPMIVEAVESDPAVVNLSTDPLRFSDVDLMEREISYGRSGFQLQFMLDTTLSDADRYPLKLGDLVIMSCASDRAPERLAWASSTELIIQGLPCVGLNGDRYYRPMWIDDRWTEYTGSVMAIDPSGRGKDETGYAVAKMLNGYVFVPEAGGLTGGYEPKTLEKLVDIAKRNKVNHVIVEKNFGDGMFTELLKPYLKNAGYPVAIDEVSHSKQKELRIIDTLEPVMNQHRLVIDPKVVERDIETAKVYALEQQLKYQLMYQMSHLTRDRGSLGHDDRLDALAMAVQYWVEQMAQDAEVQTKNRRNAELDRELRNFKTGMTRDGFYGLVTGFGKAVKGSLRWIE